MEKIYHSLTELIGRTPLLEIRQPHHRAYQRKHGHRTCLDCLGQRLPAHAHHA